MYRPIRIVLTGVESSGKSALAKVLASHFGIPVVEEYAREYLKEIKTAYTQNDLVEIAIGQLIALSKPVRKKMLIADTDLQVIKIWSLVKYKNVDPFILKEYENSKADLYILCNPNDVAWEYDELRENEYDRHEIHKMYLNELTANNLNYIEAKGTLDERKIFCIKYITEHFSSYI